MKDICDMCGNEYDVNEWASCPHCKRKRFRERHPNKYPYPNNPWDKFKYYCTKSQEEKTC